MTAVFHSSDAVGAAFAELARRAGRRPRVLLLGNYGNGNLGDEAILARLAELITSTCDLTVVARNPGRVRELHDVPAVGTTTAAGVRAYLAADVVAIGGGGIFGFGMPPLPKLLPLVALVARLLRKRTAYTAIGAYAGMPPAVRTALRLSARSSALVSVRDEESAQTMGGRIWGRRVHPLLVRDPAIDLTPVGPEAAARLIEASGARAEPPPLAVSLKPTGDPGLDERAMAVAVEAVDRWCARSEADVVFLALSSRGDYGLGEDLSDLSLVRRLAERVARPDRLFVLGPDLHPADVKGVVAQSAGMVGLRLHAQIFAWSTGRPLLGLSFERKSEAFLSQAGAERLWLADDPGDRVRAWVERL